MSEASTPPLDVLDHAFHAQYGAARIPQHAPPVLAVVGNELVVFHRGGRRAYTFVPDGARILKAAAHAPVGLFVALLRMGSRDPAELRAKIGPLQVHLDASLARLPGEDLRPEARADVARVLEATSAFASRVLAAGAAPSDDERDAFAREVGPTLLALTSHATKLQLTALDDHVTAILATFSDEERRALQVVVTGDHQARARNLGMQYFTKRLHEPEGAGERVTYAESVATAEEAFALVGTRQLDGVIAGAFFGDPKRLQQDVLGDAVAAQLADVDFPDKP